MSHLTQSQGKTLCKLIRMLQPDWSMTGIENAVRAVSELADGAETCRVAIAYATDPDMATPGLMAKPGPHWAKTVTGSRQPPTPCGDHPDHAALGCPECKTRPVATPDFIQKQREMARQKIHSDTRTHHERITQGADQ